MSDDSWPLLGPGVRKEEPGRFKERSGPPRSKRYKLYHHWRNEVDLATFGVPCKTTVDPGRFQKNVGMIRDRLVAPGDPYEDLIMSAITSFAGDIKAKRLDVKGKDVWSVFMGRWFRYVKPRREAPTNSPPLDWTDRFRKR
jgi:hypothetical protein